MSELRVGVMDYADFKDRTLIVARGASGFPADGPAVWFADSVAVGRALGAGVGAGGAGQEGGGPGGVGVPPNPPPPPGSR